MNDTELLAMNKANDAVKDLDEEQRVRVIQWLAARYMGNYKSLRVVQPEEVTASEQKTPLELETGVTNYSTFAEFLAASNNDKMKSIDRLLLAAYWLQIKEGQDKWQGYQLTKLMNPTGFPVDHVVRTMKPLMKGTPAKMFQNGQDNSKEHNSESFTLTPAGITAAENLIGTKLPKGNAETGNDVIKKKQEKVKRTVKAKESFSIVKDLDLSERTNTQSLRSFYDQKLPGNEMEHVAVFVYYLERIAGVEKVTLNHIYTCYKDINRKVPGIKNIALKSASLNGWIDTSTLDSIKVAMPGENFIEFDLPKKKPE